MKYRELAHFSKLRRTASKLKYSIKQTECGLKFGIVFGNIPVLDNPFLHSK